MPTTKFIISKDGLVQVEGIGFEGLACQAADKPYLDRLNPDPAARTEELLPEALSTQAEPTSVEAQQ